MWVVEASAGNNQFREYFLEHIINIITILCPNIWSLVIYQTPLNVNGKAKSSQAEKISNNSDDIFVCLVNFLLLFNLLENVFSFFLQN